MSPTAKRLVFNLTAAALGVGVKAGLDEASTKQERALSAAKDELFAYIEYLEGRTAPVSP